MTTNATLEALRAAILDAQAAMDRAAALEYALRCELGLAVTVQLAGQIDAVQTGIVAVSDAEAALARRVAAPVPAVVGPAGIFSRSRR